VCGIVGYIGPRDADRVLLSGLRKLEYRGYDSAGVATLRNGVIDIRRAVGKLDNLEAALAAAPATGSQGIGHTRWATHGRPTEVNAHPHRAGDIVVIHNGIIENYVDLREELAAEGVEMASETDTEVICWLIERETRKGLKLVEAVRSTIGLLQGSFAIVVLSAAEPGTLVTAKNATPVVLGVGDGENFIASDVPALLDYTRDVLFLEDGELAELTADEVRIFTFDGTRVEREPKHITWDPVTAQKGGYKHFLLKEIHEQPQALIDTMRGRISQDEGRVVLGELDAIADQLGDIRRLTLVACGTAWHACLVGKYLIERFARLPVEVDYGSEFRYRDPVIDKHTLLVVVSQSGETADTLAAVEAARERGTPVIAICNVVDSSIARKVDGTLFTHAGPEISVASTKAFTTQLTAFTLLALWLGRRSGSLAAETEAKAVQALVELPLMVEACLSVDEDIAAAARTYHTASDMLYLARGINYPIALEGALKLKEISYIHAEGYPAGEMKHGPIALIDDEMPVVVVIPADEVFDKTLSNLREVESRGGRIIAITDSDSKELEQVAETLIRVPSSPSFLLPILLTVPMQLFAYHVAVERGTDVDQPRNLAKSVTVE
jgi:glucosamine--fructose-6-phosphate aminotransferase (isomerizing)